MSEARQELFAAALAFVLLRSLGAEIHESVVCVALAAAIRGLIRRIGTGRWGFPS